MKESENLAARMTGAELIYSVVMILCIIGALISLYLGFAEAENAIQQIDFLALSAVLGIFARIAQAAKHREEDRLK